MVSLAPTRSAEHAAPHTIDEAARPLRLLRHHVELRGARALSLDRRRYLAPRTLTPLAAVLRVEQDACTPEATPVASAAHRSSIRHVANLFLEEPDAGNLHVRICGGSARRLAELPDTLWTTPIADEGWAKSALPTGLLLSSQRLLFP